MQLALRLYYPIDADLIAIRLREKRQFTTLIREKLLRLLDPTVKDLKAKDLYHIPENIRNYVRNPTEPIRVNLTLMEGRDDLIINYISKVKPSVRCDTIKNLFRMCFDSYRDDIFPMGLFLDMDKTCSARIPAKQTEHTEIKKAKTVKIPVLEKHPAKGKDVVKDKSEEIKIETSQPPESVKETVNSTSDPTLEKEKEIIKEPDLNTSSPPVHQESNTTDVPEQEADGSEDSTAYEMFQKLLGY